MNAVPYIALLLWITLFAVPFSAVAAPGAPDNAEKIALPPPNKTGGKPLMQTLSLRASNRNIQEAAISQQDLGNLLWAAWGMNRADGHRTVPTARNMQAVLLYVALADGVWLYDGAQHSLLKVLDEDVRARFANAPVTLIYTAEEGPYAGMHVGSMYQNVGLYCASAGLANVVKATGRDVLANRLPLPPQYSILIIQLLGKPADR